MLRPLLRILVMCAGAVVAGCGAAAPQAPEPAATPVPANVIAAPMISGGTDLVATPQPSAIRADASATVVIALPGLSGGGDREPATAIPGPTVTPNAIGSATINSYRLSLLIVADPATRGQGLMYFGSLADDSGMLFVFPGDSTLSFWMRNTAIPLSIAFLDANGRILNIADMQPFDDQTFHTSAGPARYALEVNQGWFAERGITAGDQVVIELPDDLVVQ
ncbi:MAG TPA: DUF192 domain-containing protein [Roseiflexaceae bacterium]|nr:DUF192 domain-containing protein [Roseiflexaceae bacterium]HMP40792.1 DUF192 domain-containing protein [Roseiflexaceae bacterium]